MSIKQIFELSVYVLIFIAPAVYQRVHYHLDPAFFYKLNLRKKTGLQIHHAHWGLGWIFLSCVLMILQTLQVIHIAHFWFLVPATLGWGLFFDEIIPHLRMPSDDRDLEMKVYVEAGPATIRLITFIAVAIAVVVISINIF